MCGIAGIVRFDGTPADAARLASAARAQRLRGPDHLGVWTDPDPPRSAGLSAVRLAVQDPRPQADQPLTDATGRWMLAYNGELYNVAELRALLEEAGWSFRTTGDTETALAACATWGSSALARMEGMFALGFLDRRQRRGFIARDSAGIKPLFYALPAGGLLFASELSGLLLLGDVDPTLCAEALLHHVMMGYVPAPLTIHQGAKRLSPGCFVEFSADRAGPPQSYADLGARVRRERAAWSGAAYADAARELRRRIRRSVVRQRVSDVPLGCFLSGGVDSGIVATHLAEASSRPIETFSIGHAGQDSYDETRYARLMASRLGTTHHEWKLTEREVVEALPGILDHLDEPFGDSSIIPTTLVSRLARRSVTVALSGDGADELFGGYWRYSAHAALRAYERLPALMRRLASAVLLRTADVAKSSARGNRARQFRKLLRASGGTALDRHLAWSRILDPQISPFLMCAPSVLVELERDLIQRARQLAQPCDPVEDLDAILAFDVQSGLPGDMLHKVDLASMSCSLEVRVPFLDPDVAALALALPASWKLHGGARKRILVDAYRGILPDEVLERPKQGFEVPFGEYLRGPLLGLFREVVRRDVVEPFGLLRFEGIERALAEHLARRGEHGDLLFAVLSLCWWIRRRSSPHGV